MLKYACAALLIVMSASAWAGDAAGPDVTVINNASLRAGEMLSITEYQSVSGGPQRQVKEMTVGPVEDDCTHGCDMTSGGFGNGAGVYRLEAQGQTSDLAKATFSMKAGETYVWMVSNAGATPSYHATAPGVRAVVNKGPFRIDLINYTPAVVVKDQPQETPRKKAPSTFWPFKGKTSKSYVNN